MDLTQRTNELNRFRQRHRRIVQAHYNDAKSKADKTQTQYNADTTPIYTTKIPNKTPKEAIRAEATDGYAAFIAKGGTITTQPAGKNTFRQTVKCSARLLTMHKGRIRRR